MLGNAPGDDDVCLNHITTKKVSQNVDRVTNAHEFNITVACVRKKVAEYYNDAGLEAAKEDGSPRYTFLAYDMNRRTMDISPATLSLPSLEIPLSVTLAVGSPVRVLRTFMAHAKDDDKKRTKIPKMSFGVVESFDISDMNPRLRKARVRFELKKQTWFADLPYLFEPIDAIVNQTVSSRYYMPLSLAYGVTITSLQGLEFHNLIFDLQLVGIWIRHVLYMALTRVRSGKGIKCINVPDGDSDFNNNCPEMAELLLKFKAISFEQFQSEQEQKEALLSLDIVHIMESFKVYSYKYESIYFMLIFSVFIFFFFFSANENDANRRC